MYKLRTLVFLLALIIISIIPATAQDDSISIMHFLGECEITTLGEGCDLHAQIHMFEEETGIAVEQVLTGWPGITEFNTALAANEPPEIMGLAGAQIPNYASRGLLTPLDDLLTEAGIDVSDFTDAGLNFVTYDGQIYGLPVNIHAHVWYINVDVWAEAGLVDENGEPIIPTNEEEFLAAAAQMLETTGKPFVTFQTDGHNGTAWPLMSLIYQLGGAIADEEGNPTINTPEAAQALEFMANLYEEEYAPRLIDYTTAWNLFLNGEGGSNVNGTWVVEGAEAQVNDPESPLKNYRVVPFPNIFGSGVWGDGTAWVLPTGTNTEAAVQFLRIAFDTNIWWVNNAVTVRQSFLTSEQYLGYPLGNLTETATDAVAYPPVLWVAAADDILNEEVQAVFLGEKDIETALQDAQARLEDVVRFSN